MIDSQFTCQADRLNSGEGRKIDLELSQIGHLSQKESKRRGKLKVWAVVRYKIEVEWKQSKGLLLFIYAKWTMEEGLT